MRVDLFDFELDRDLIASKPASPRDTSKLLDVSSEDGIFDRCFYDLPNILQKGDVLVFNNTKVIPARLYGKRGLAEVEVTLYHPENGLTWWAFIKNSKRLKRRIITFAEELKSFLRRCFLPMVQQFPFRIFHFQNIKSILLSAKKII